MGPSDKKLKELENRILELGITKRDITEKFVRSSGKGGQNVNKVATCVQLKHLPSGMMVKVGSERSQNLNRFLAMRLLVDKIEESQTGKKGTREKAADKIRKQKSRRRKRAKSKNS